jgi:hypothetical protein
MKKLLFTLAVALGINASASHLLGGYIQTTQRGFTDTVDITVTIFTDPQGLPASQTISMVEWKQVNNFYQQNATFNATQQSSGTWQGVNVYVYSVVKVLSSGDYRFIYTHCCRGMLTNASSSANSNFTIALDYKKTTASIPNSAPILVNPLPINWVVGDTAQSILFAIDLDGDSVLVEMDNAINQHANNTFVPLAPFSQLSSYGYYNVAGDGTITWSPTTVGKFGTGYKISEYRNGSLIGVSRVQQVYVTQPGSTPNVPWPPVLIQHDMLNGDSTSIFIQVNNFISTSLTFPGVDVVQNTATSWDLLNLLPGTYKGVLRASSNSSNNDYYITLRVVSTIGIQEYNLTNLKYDVYDWYGRYVGNDLDGLKGLFVIRYSNGKSEKVFVN